MTQEAGTRQGAAPRGAPRSMMMFLFLTVLMSMIGMGIIIPVIPALIAQAADVSISQAAALGGYLTLVFALAQFVMAPILGNLSDRFGRRPVILVSLFAYGLDFFLMALAPNYAWLFIARLCSGLFAATSATANAVVADITPPDERPRNFGILGAAFGLGFIIGPLIGGVLGEIDPRVPFVAAGTLSLFTCAFGYFALPETLRPENRRPFSLRTANPVASFKAIGTIRPVVGFLLVYFLFQLAHTVYPAIWAYFGAVAYGWSEGEIGYSLAYVGLTSAFVQGYLTGKVTPLIGPHKAFLIGGGALVISMIGFGVFSPGGLALYGFITLNALAGFMMPSLQSIMTKKVPQSRQGELQGVLASLMGLTLILGPVSFSQIFSYYTAPGAALFLPGAPFLVGGGVSALSVLSFVVFSRQRAGALKES